MTETQTNQQQRQSRFEPSQAVQTELATLNVRYRDMQETMGRLITILAAENAELKTENATLKKQFATGSDKKQF